LLHQDRYQGPLATYKRGCLIPIQKLRKPSSHVIFSNLTSCCHIFPHIDHFPQVKSCISPQKSDVSGIYPTNTHLSSHASHFPIGHSTRPMHQPVLFPKSFSINFAALSALCAPPQPRNARVVSMQYFHLADPGMDAESRLGRRAAHVIIFCTCAWTAVDVALFSALLWLNRANI